MFGAAEVHDTLVSLAPFATTAESTQSLCIALHNVAVVEYQRTFGTLEVRDSLLSLVPIAVTDSDAVVGLCNAIGSIVTRNTRNQQIFGTGEVRDALADGTEWDAPHLIIKGTRTSPASRGTATRYQTSALFATEAVWSALVRVAAHAMSDSVTQLCYAIGNLASCRRGTPPLPQIVTVALRDALVR